MSMQSKTINQKLIDYLLAIPVNELKWVAGFLDGDGTILCRIKVKSDYRFGYQLEPEVTFIQLKRRAVYLFPYLQNLFGGIGGIRAKSKTIEGVWVYEITTMFEIYAFLLVLEPHLVLKRKQAQYMLSILRNYDTALRNPTLSINLCRKADRIAWLNDSKSRIGTTAVAVQALKDRNISKKLNLPAWVLNTQY